MKPNGEPINSDPYSKHSDNDGLEDNEELHFSAAKMTYELDKAQYDGSVFVWSDPTKADSDGDGLDDDLEQLLGTSPIISDTDNDGLSDGFEIELWYDPLDSNPDRDSYNDKEEYQNGTDPFTYDQTYSEWNADFVKGFFLGDFVDCNSVPTLLGQVTSGFVPVVADARDVIANGSNGEWGYALLSGIGLVPAAGDVAKIAGSLGEFIAKHIDDAPTIIKAISKIAEQIPDIAKYLPSSALDNIAKSLKSGQSISKKEYLKLKEIFQTAGKNLDEFLGITFKYADEIDFKSQTLIDELASSGEKYTLNNIEFIVKTPDGKLMWLEKGNAKAGLEHILLRHESQLATRGITDVKTFLYNVMEQVPVLKGTSDVGPFAEYIINGERYRVIYGTNGFIVSLFPI